MSLQRRPRRSGHRWSGGGGGIRTPETLTGLTVFKTAGFNRSPTPPHTNCLLLAYFLGRLVTMPAVWSAYWRGALHTMFYVDTLTLFGLFAVTAMVVCYALEKRSPGFILAFAGSYILASAYGFLQGAWPFGLVEAVWSMVALQRWWHARNAT